MGTAENESNTIAQLTEASCDDGVTQCLKVQASAAGVSGYTYSCSDKTEKEDGCHKVEQTILGLSINAETCVCTGNLCNSASARGINFILAFFCLLTARSNIYFNIPC